MSKFSRTIMYVRDYIARTLQEKLIKNFSNFLDQYDKHVLASIYYISAMSELVPMSAVRSISQCSSLGRTDTKTIRTGGIFQIFWNFLMLSNVIMLFSGLWKSGALSLL